MKKMVLAASVAAIVSVTPALAADVTAPAVDVPVTTTTTTETEMKTDVVAPPAAEAEIVVTTDAAVGTNTVADVASADASLSTLVSALKAAEWVEPLKGAGPYTVFAPSNAAFEALPAGTLENLLKPENKEKLQNVLKHHVVEGKIAASDIAEGSTDVKAMNGTNLKVEKNATSVTVGGAQVTQADIAASNGVIHMVDKVIVE
ncbi:MAG: fasciclin domain-containing protein [Alphaproteobacteria bacterium]